MKATVIIPRYFPGEQEAIREVLAHGHAYGFGNMIARLRDEWSRTLQTKEGFPVHSADMAAGHICVWCNVDSRTGKKAKKSRAR